MTCKTFQIQTISVLNGRFYGTCCVWPNRFFNGLAFGEEPDIDWDWFFFSLWLTSMKSIWERFSDYVPLNDGGDHIPRLLWTKNHLQFVLYTVRVCFCCCCARPHDIWEASNLNPEYKRNQILLRNIVFSTSPAQHMPFIDGKFQMSIAKGTLLCNIQTNKILPRNSISDGDFLTHMSLRTNILHILC